MSGANLGTLLHVLMNSGGVRPARLPQAAVALGACLGRWPFTTAERAYVAYRRRRMPPPRAPIFIVGHWRSGTTHLYNVMSKAGYGYVPPVAAGMPWDLLGLVAMLRPLMERSLPKTRFIDAIPVLPDSPQEDEVAMANMGPVSFYHALYFPKRFERYFERGIFLNGGRDTELWQRAFLCFIDKLTLHHDGRRILLKNPVYSARIGLIRELYPDAKFIHIYRNPYDVFPSMRNFYVKLFEELALQHFDHVAVDQVILDTYERMMSRLIEDRALLAGNQFVELSYEQLIEDPLGQLERIYDTLELPAYALHREHFAAYLESVRSYRRNSYSDTQDTAALVERHWGAFLDHWGYPRRGAGMFMDGLTVTGGG